MFITNKQFTAIENALKLLPQAEEFEALTEEQKQTILEADRVMIDLWMKQKQANEKTARIIAEKRKANKNYGRSIDENGKQKQYGKKKKKQAQP